MMSDPPASQASGRSGAARAGRSGARCKKVFGAAKRRDFGQAKTFRLLGYFAAHGKR